MNLSSVYHISADSYCYPLDENRLMIKLRTDYDVDRAELVWGDPFECGMFGGDISWDGTHSDMLHTVNLERHKVWQLVVEPKYKRCRYFFVLHSGKETVYMLEDGFKSQDEFKNYQGRRQDFFFPWINSSDIVRPASWVNKTIWYQIFPDRFCNSGTDRGIKYHKWSSPDKKASNAYLYGGDLKGACGKLDYLKDLGITGLYFTPVNESPSNHKYDTADYNRIDKSFGSDKDMKELVAQAHLRGMRVMLDGVFNHCGEQFKPWQDVLEKGKDSRYFNWFMINKYPFSKTGCRTRKGEYYSFAFVDCMPKLNTNNPEAAQYFIDVCSRWITEYDIDAIRLDVSDELAHSFIKKLRIALIKLKPDFYICGEAWHNSTAWLRGDEFDAIMNYPLQEVIGSYWKNRNMTAKEFEYRTNYCYDQYHIQTNNAMLNLLDSHDTMRLMTGCGNNEDIFYQKLIVLFTMSGSTCIYYGTEIGLEGGYDPDCRRPMPWREIENGCYDERLSFMKRIIKMRKEYKSLRSGQLRFIKSGCDRVLMYEKYDEESVVRVIVNCSGKPVEADIRKGNLILQRCYTNGYLGVNGAAVIKY